VTGTSGNPTWTGSLFSSIVMGRTVHIWPGAPPTCGTFLPGCSGPLLFAYDWAGNPDPRNPMWRAGTINYGVSIAGELTRLPCNYPELAL